MTDDNQRTRAADRWTAASHRTTGPGDGPPAEPSVRDWAALSRGRCAGTAGLPVPRAPSRPPCSRGASRRQHPSRTAPRRQGPGQALPFVSRREAGDDRRAAVCRPLTVLLACGVLRARRSVADERLRMRAGERSPDRTGRRQAAAWITTDSDRDRPDKPGKLEVFKFKLACGGTEPPHRP